MTHLTEVESHVASMSELLDIVGAMRALASMRVQEAHHALPGVRRYADSMAGADALRLIPERAQARRASNGPVALIACMAEHGFVGGFNERLLDAIGQGKSDRQSRHRG